MIRVNIGDRYGKLTVLRELEHRRNKSNYVQRLFLLKCDCGNETQSTLNHIRNGNKRSCGCIKMKRNGLGTHRLAHIWTAMIRRCHGESNRSKYYRDRGIRVCNEWKNNFMSFYEWSINNGHADGLQIDRINNDGDYDPNNCRWVTAKINANNRRKPIWQISQ